LLRRYAGGPESEVTGSIIPPSGGRNNQRMLAVSGRKRNGIILRKLQEDKPSMRCLNKRWMHLLQSEKKSDYLTSLKKGVKKVSTTHVAGDKSAAKAGPVTRKRGGGGGGGTLQGNF